MGRTLRRARRSVVLLLSLVLAISGFVGVAPHAAAAPYPPLPLAYSTTLVSNLTGTDIAPGGQSALSFEVTDPPAFAYMHNVIFTLDVYAFNAFPGNATSSIDSAATPVLLGLNGSGTTVNISLDTLFPGDHFYGSVGVGAASSTPSGTYAVRTALSFTANGTAYRLASRGWFTASAWAAATELGNGSTTLNLSKLGVSGVLPETAILIATSDWDWALALVLGASIVLVGAAAFVYFRRGPKSSAGAR